MGRKIQTAGVAPTDDCFTVIAPGPSDIDQDGPALVGDPDMGFSNLRHFGPTLVHHTQLKIRSGIATSSFMMIDSPGMIDSPVTSTTTALSSISRNKVMDRGYDFEGVVRWFAERADVILLFFDPDKPGTTGETLSILVNSLGGMDHKLYVVLNKADQFKKIHDFARAYGSLCWNLSKVIPRKDLPRIYTMCVPVVQPGGTVFPPPALLADGTVAGGDPTGLASGLADLHQTRDDVVAEVMKAPKRRIDNAITRLGDSISMLLMHAQVVQETKKRYSSLVWRSRAEVGFVALSGGGLTAGAVLAGLPPTVAAGGLAATFLASGGLHFFNGKGIRSEEKFLTSTDGIAETFRRTHTRQLSEHDEFTASVWGRVREPLQLTLKAVGLDNVETVTDKEINELNTILDEEIPRLRRVASPAHFGQKKAEFRSGGE